MKEKKLGILFFSLLFIISPEKNFCQELSPQCESQNENIKKIKDSFEKQDFILAKAQISLIDISYKNCIIIQRMNLLLSIFLNSTDIDIDFNSSDSKQVVLASLFYLFRGDSIHSRFLIKSNGLENESDLAILIYILSSSENSIQIETYQSKYSDLLKNKKNYILENSKSPLIALSLSIFIPGLGQYYSNQTGEALSAFIFTSICFSTTYALYTINPLSVPYYFMITFSTLMYSTNLVGAYSSANRSNAFYSKNYHFKIKKEFLNINILLDYIYK